MKDITWIGFLDKSFKGLCDEQGQWHLFWYLALALAILAACAGVFALFYGEILSWSQ